MRAEIIQIGNSKGLRIPKVVLDQCGLKGEVDMRVEDHSLIITPVSNIREGWEKKFQVMAQNHDDALLDPEQALSSWDEEEWTW